MIVWGGERNPTLLINRLVNRKTQIDRQDAAAGTMPPPSFASSWPAFLRNLLRVDTAVALGLIFIWAAVLAGGAFLLPTQAASWITFLALVILPGYLMGDLLTLRLDLDQIERLAMAFPLGMAVLTVPGLSALLMHWTMDQLALGWAGCTGLVVVIWLGVRLSRAWAQVERTPSAPWKADEIVLAALLLGAFLVVLPAMMLYKIDGDAYAVNSFATDALAGLPLNKVEPLFGTDLGPGVRMAFNQSLPLAYLWSFWSGIDQNELTAVASRAMIALWAIFSSYMLGRAAGVDLPGPVRGRRFGLLVASVQVLIYMAAPFLRGDNVSLFFFERTTADKFMVPVTMLPVVMALGIHYLRQGERGAWWAAAVGTLAVSAIHPLIAAMLALALGAFSALNFLLHWRQWKLQLRSIALGALVVAAMFLPLVQLVLSRGEEPLAVSYPHTLDGWPIGHRLVPALPFVNVATLDVYGPLPDLTQLDASETQGTMDPFLIWRFAVNMTRRRLLLFNLNSYISDPNILLEPPYILALLLLPLLLPGIRRSLGAQFAVSTSVAILAVMYNPVVTPLIGSLVMPWILWRFVWLLPYALIMALAVTPAINWAARTVGRQPSAQVGASRGRESMLTRFTPVVVVLALALLLSPMIVRNLEAMEERADYPYYFPTPQHLLTRLAELTAAQGPATVMADQDLSVSIPSYVANANIVAHRAPTTSEVFPATQQDIALQRLIDQADFFKSRYLTSSTIDILNRYQVGYIVAPSGSDLEVQLRLASQNFQWVMDDQSYSLYRVLEIPALSAALRGNTALAERQWDEAEKEYNDALAADPGDLLALAGMGEIAHARGRFNDALTWYQKALAQIDLPVLHYRLGQLYTQLGQIDTAAAEFDIAQSQSPNVARYHVSAGDACLSLGNEDCATQQYTLAAADHNLPDRASQLIILADLWRQRGRTDHALTLYAQAAELQPSEMNQLMLASAYYEEARYDEAKALLSVLRNRYPLSNDVMTLSAQVQAAQGDYEGAISLYRREIWLQDLTAQESATTRLALAQTLLAATRTTEAQEELNRVLTLQPNNASAHALQGDIYRAQHDESAATIAYRDAFRLDPSQVQLYLALDNQYRQMGGAQTEMLDLLETAMRANPDEPTLALALGDHLQRQGETARAIDAYQSALDMFEQASVNNSLSLRGNDTSRAYVYTRLASVSEDLGQIEPAMNYYSAAVAAAPDRAWTQLMYGDALRRRNQVAEAESAYRRAIADDPEFANGYVQLADLLASSGNTVEANVLRQQALEVAFSQAAQPKLTQSLAQSSQAAQDDGISQSFNSDASTTANTSPSGSAGANTPQEQANRLMGELAADGGEFFQVGDGTGVLNLLTRLAQDTGDEERAIELFQRALDQGRREGWYPTILAQYHKGLGDLYMAQGQPMMAADSYRAAIGLDGWWPQAQLGLATALESLGETELARSQLQSAVEIAPGYVDAEVALADFDAQHGNKDAALQRYQQIASEHPGDPRATLVFAQALQARQQWDEAEDVYRRTLALTPGNSEAYVELASLLMEQARYSEAKPMLLAALETNQLNMNAHIQMGVLEQQQGNAAEAVEWFKRAVRVRPSNQPVSLVLIDLLQRFGHYELSLTYLADALKLQPTNLEMILRQARAQRLLGRTGDALTTLLAAAQNNLADAQLSAELGELYVAQGRPDAALAAYRQTVALQPAEEAYYIRLAALWRSQADFNQAQQILRSGLPQVKQPASLYAALADLYLQQGMAQDAKTLLDSAIDQLGSQTALVVAMGAYFESQAVQDVVPDDSAEHWYTGYLQAHPNDTAVLMALGEHYLRRGMTAEAVQRYEQVVALTPTVAEAHVALAKAYNAANQTDDAVAALQQAIILDPTVADGYVELAKLYRTAGRPTDAQAIYDSGLKLVPNDGPLYIAYCDFLVDQGQKDLALIMLEKAGQVAPTVEMLLARATVYTKLSKPDAALADLKAATSKEPGSLDALLALGDFYRDAGNTQEAQAAYAKATKLSPGIGAGRVRLARLSR
jgi:tetratricopeptide (TPR) repeat protein